MTQVLVVGYGKIGIIKSSIWQSLGAEVYVYDINKATNAAILRDGYRVFRKDDFQSYDSIIDISTPAGQHFNGLRWALDSIEHAPKAILIEKPLASSGTEIAQFIELLNNFNAYDISKRIFVNETYYSSTALEYLRRQITLVNSKFRVNIELSKNRLIDNDNGRFFDLELGAVGIEVPHMIAILQVLGVRLETLKSGSTTILGSSNRIDNQGFVYRLRNKDVSIDLASYLGDFRKTNDSLTTNYGVVRRLQVVVGSATYTLEFDPAEGVPRYHSRLTIQHADHEPEVLIMVDDHLKKHMDLFLRNEVKNIPPLLGISSALLTASLLVSIKKDSTTEIVSGYTEHTIAPQEVLIK